MNKNSGVQSLRAIAACMVLLQHGIVFACIAKGIDYIPYLPIGFSGLGVSTFFAISGYVMTLCLPQGRMFIVQRIARIYPAYWLAIAVGAVVMPLIGEKFTIDLRSISLIPTKTFNESYSIPYWTLIYEMVFYVIVYTLILAGASRRVMASCMIVWAIAIAVICQTNIHPDFSGNVGALTPGWWIFLSPQNFMFITGFVYGLIGQGFFKRMPIALILALSVAGLVVAYANIPYPLYQRFLVFGLGCTPLIEIARRISVPEFMRRAGDYSYGLYLTHTIFIHVAMLGMVRFFPHAQIWYYFAAALAFPLIAGLMFGAVEFDIHQRIIKPLLRRRSANPLERNVVE